MSIGVLKVAILASVLLSAAIAFTWEPSNGPREATDNAADSDLVIEAAPAMAPTVLRENKGDRLVDRPTEGGRFGSSDEPSPTELHDEVQHLILKWQDPSMLWPQRNGEIT